MKNFIKYNTYNPISMYRIVPTYFVLYEVNFFELLNLIIRDVLLRQHINILILSIHDKSFQFFFSMEFLR